MSDEERKLAQRAKAKSGPVEDYADPDTDPDGPSAADIARFSHVTVNCKGCGTELLDDVQECWKCGRAVGAASSHESGRPNWFVFTAIGLILVVVLWYVL